jgi:uncharacterized lipoprotein NlpE involved in copper resistance
MKKIILSLTALALFGCSNEKAQDSGIKAADTVYIEKASAAPEITAAHKNKTAPAPKKDVLDKANDGLDKANTTATKTGQVLDNAAELKKKTDAILNH